MTEPISAIIVGAGHRSLIYAGLSDIEPNELKIVGIAEPDEYRRNMVAEKYHIPPEHCFKNVEELVKVPKFADVAINGTMDQIHVETSIPLLKAGYDLLLEKPFAVNEEEAHLLVSCAKETNRKIMICFVLRYTGFYREIKKIVASGEIGDIINIQMAEHVSYHHMLTSYVRGKWANSNRCHTSMLLAKSSHDIDVMMWLMDKDNPVKVSAFGSLMQFRKERAPKKAGTRCVVDCPIESTCPYSARKVYFDHPDHWSCYIWDKLEAHENATDEDRLELLKTSPYGVCAYKSDNNVVDHQSICIEFASGATGTHNMIGGSAYSVRTIHIIGTKGEISGNLESDKFTVSLIDPKPDCGYTQREVDIKQICDTQGGHGGGDLNLIRDFVHYVRDGETSISCTSIEDAVKGHLVVFKADESMEHGGEPQTIVL